LKGGDLKEGGERRGNGPTLNPEMVECTPHPGPLPIGSADSADAEREKHSQRLREIVRRKIQGKLTLTLPHMMGDGTAVAGFLRIG
jgi:hypothetical protein